MVEFANYYIDFLVSLWHNFVTFLESFFGAFYNIFLKDLPEYLTQIGEHVGLFGVLDWVLFIFEVLLNATLIFFLGYRFFQLLRRYIFFRAKEVEKDKLLEEIAQLKKQAEDLASEKGKLFALKVNGEIRDAKMEASAGGQMTTATGANGEVLQTGASRFSKLIEIDAKYKDSPHYVFMSDEHKISLSQLVDNFIKFSASRMKLFYEAVTIRAYMAGMATSKIIILEGISGTGKTSLPYAMGKYFGNDTTIVSVQPSWRDRAELLGYLNEFTKRFNESDFLAGLYETTFREDPSFIVLDEMNLSRIEYYFAEFLSIMEMPDISEWQIDIVPNGQPSDPKHLTNGKLLVPQNVWFVGTANNDDSTFTITDKVYDRAVAITINKKALRLECEDTPPAVCSYDYLNKLFKQAQEDYKVSSDCLMKLRRLDTFITDNFNKTFGNRIMKQINVFVPVYMACGGDEDAAIDFIIATKILKKFTSLNLAFLGKELAELKNLIERLYGKGKMIECLKVIREYEKQV